MTYYLVSLFIFILMACYLSFLLGKIRNQVENENTLSELEGLKKVNASKLDEIKELEVQLRSQSETIRELVEKGNDTAQKISKIENEKKLISTQSNELISTLEQSSLELNHLQSKLANYDKLEDEALTWKNKYAMAYSEYSSNFKKLLSTLHGQKMFIESLLNQKYSLLSQFEDALIRQDLEPNILSHSVTPRNEIATMNYEINENMEMALKIKRQDNIIKALRLQLRNLNLQNLSDSGHTASFNYDSEDDLHMKDNLEHSIRHDSNGIEEENSYSELLSEVHASAEIDIDSLDSFIEKKVRKTGDINLDYTRVAKRAQRKKVEKNSIQSSSKNSDLKADRMTSIFNIDRRIEKKLHSKGFTKYQDLVNLTIPDLRRLEIELDLFPHQISEEKWQEQAEKLVNSKKSKILEIPKSEGSSNIHTEEAVIPLQSIKGIGKTYAKKLLNAGIESLEDLSDVREEQIDELAIAMDISARLIRKQRWIEQAQNKIKKIRNT